MTPLRFVSHARSQGEIPPPARAHALPRANPANVWNASVRRILCFRPDNLGDVLMTSPALAALKQQYPNRHLTLLASRSGAAAARHIPAIDEVIEFDVPWALNEADADPARTLTLVERLRAGQFDAAVIFTVYSQNPLPAAMVCHLAGIPRRLGFCRENPYALLNDWVPECEPERTLRHEAARQLALVAAVGAQLDECDEARRLCFAVPASARASLAARHALGTGRYLVLHPGATAASRRYPAERFAQVAAVLAHRTGMPCCLSGSSGEAALTAGIAQAAGAALRDLGGDPALIRDLAGQLSLGELGALIEGAAVLVTNNSGPLHMASALGTPVVALYALTNPQHGPWLTPHRLLAHDVPCRWCYRSVCPEGHHRCLRGVSGAEVVDAALALLAEGAARQAQPPSLSTLTTTE